MASGYCPASSVQCPVTRLHGELQLQLQLLVSIAMPMSDSLCCYAPQSMLQAAPESSTLLNLLLLLWRIKWPKSSRLGNAASHKEATRG